MATDRIGIRHSAGQVAGALMSSGTKRRVEELGGHMVSTVVGGVVDWSMSAWVARYEARTSADNQLDRLRTLSIMVHSAVEAAEGVHIRSWWLRRWLRDAAFDGDEVLRLFRQRRTAEETDAASRQATAGNMVWRALWSAKSLVFGRGDDPGVERLSRVVARLEREAMGLSDFLKMLELEIRRSPPVQRPARPMESAPPVQVPPLGLLESNDNIIRRFNTGSSSYRSISLESLGAAAASCVSPPPHRVAASEGQEENKIQQCCPEDGGDGSRFDHGLSSISHEEYVAGVRKVGLPILRRRIQRVLDMLIIRKKPPADTDRLRELVASIRLAVVPSTGSANLADFRRNRSWLARWRNHLLSMAFKAEYQLLAVSLAGDGADAIGRMRWTVQNVETAAAHLEDFVTLAGFALPSLDRSSVRSQLVRVPTLPKQRQILFRPFSN